MARHPHILYGRHAAVAALANPMRKIRRILVTENTRKDLGEKVFSGHPHVSMLEAGKLDSQLPKDAVHQGIAIECEPLNQPAMHDWLAEGIKKPVLLLDQVSDPHNVGAILRSAAAFDAGAVILTDRNAPTESGIMAKSASGAMELVPLIAVTNLVKAIEILKKHEYWVAGLDGHAEQMIGDAKLGKDTALVLGAEGKGLRRLTGEHCDYLVKLPMSDRMESLNVSNAAAVALYELFRKTI
ncbi:MAG: 23S rRNA (guanosine(2251)-2'-O)-methyltransferase RlmB [Alphaproteobacteria bacterium]